MIKPENFSNEFLLDKNWSGQISLRVLAELTCCNFLSKNWAQNFILKTSFFYIDQKSLKGANFV